MERRDDSPLCVYFSKGSRLTTRKIELMENVKNQSEMNLLIESYPSLQKILQNIKQVVWVLDMHTNRIIFVSPAFETVWGRSRESLYADPMTLIKSVHPEDRVKVLATKPDNRHQSVTQSYRIQLPNGSLRLISADLFLIRESAFNLSYQVCVAQDITSQDQVDQTLRKALNRSHEQSTLSRRMSLARKPEAVLKTLMSASEFRAAQRAFVLFYETLPNNLPRVLDVITTWLSVEVQNNSNEAETENDGRLFEHNLMDHLAISELYHPSKPVILSNISKDQRLAPAARQMLEEGHIQTIGTFPLVASGNLLGCLLVLFPEEKHFASIELRHIKVLVDQAAITLYNLQLLEIEADSRHEAERANEIKTEFLAMISHELRTPLTSIIGFTTTLLADDVTWEANEQRDFIKTIHQEANRLHELIDHLLVLSRLEAGRLPISLDAHSLHDIIDDAMPQLRSLTSEHPLSVHLPDSLPLIYADAKRIAQVLVNLVRNASTYAARGTEISISGSVRGRFVHINVTDQGPGIPQAEYKKVFQAFRRGETVENGLVQGAGLGLAICKGLVEAQGGSIWVKKKSIPGATLCFTIPLVPLQAQTKSTEGER
jgi:PAS domain S-box-containing protein